MDGIDPSGHDIDLDFGFDIKPGSILGALSGYAPLTSESGLGVYAPQISLSKKEPWLMMERLFLAEVQSPTHAGFVLPAAEKSIQAMGLVLYDRLFVNRLGYKHLHYPSTLLGVVRQPGQFGGVKVIHLATLTEDWIVIFLI